MQYEEQIRQFYKSWKPKTWGWSVYQKLYCGGRHVGLLLDLEDLKVINGLSCI
jgi:hypothetical protein